MPEKKVMIGCAAGFAGDRKDAAPALVQALSQHDGPRFMMFEMLAERTLALAQQDRRNNPDRGYVRAIEAMLRPYLKSCADAGIKIVSNFGAGNPQAAARMVEGWARELGLKHFRVACVGGDDLLDSVTIDTLMSTEAGAALLTPQTEIAAVNVYLGAAPIAAALDQGADMVITGRVADPMLALGPLVHVFGWAEDDWDHLAAGVLAGHLLECGPQITGGYFADPGVKDVAGMAEIGYPLATITSDGRCEISKPEGTGGLVDLRTVKEQILYEIQDPAAYMTPDVVLDLSGVEVEQIAPDRVRVCGARGKPRPDKLKATVCFPGGYLVESEISYAGINAEARARLAIETIRTRLERAAPHLRLRADIIGLVSIFGDVEGQALAERKSADRSPDLRVIFTAEASSVEEGRLLVEEVEALYVSGPAGGGGIRNRITPRLKTASCLLPRALAQPHFTMAAA